MSLEITRTAAETIIEHARRDAPIEACGYLASKNGEAVDAVVPLTNVDRSPEHFSFDPGEQFQALRKIRSAGRKLQAVYHSHPLTPARPSAEDLRLAYDPTLSYVIVSLAGPEPVVRSFRIRKGEAEEEAVILLKSRTQPGC